MDRAKTKNIRLTFTLKFAIFSTPNEEKKCFPDDRLAK